MKKNLASALFHLKISLGQMILINNDDDYGVHDDNDNARDSDDDDDDDDDVGCLC